MAVTGLTRNQFAGFTRHMGSNPIVSVGGVLSRESSFALVSGSFPFQDYFAPNIIRKSQGRKRKHENWHWK